MLQCLQSCKGHLVPMDFADDLPEENSAWFCQKRFIKKLAAEDIVHELKHCSTGAAGSLVLGLRRVEPHCKSTETVARHSYDSFAFLDVLDFVSAFRQDDKTWWYYSSLRPLHFRLIQAIQTPIRGPSLVARVNGAGHSSWWLPYFAQFCLELAPASMCIYMYLSCMYLYVFQMSYVSYVVIFYWMLIMYLRVFVMVYCRKHTLDTSFARILTNRDLYRHFLYFMRTNT